MNRKKDIKTEKEIAINTSTCNQQFPTNLLLSFTAATLCSALSVKFLKKGELALMTTLMVMPLAIIYLNKRAAQKKFKWTKAPIF
ncbi:hypothetical protein GCM10027566_31160 [Arachidicoccus ginsenosidivorans]|uniref:Uncharacterized protein n=1 Tax=Arachidicoccus ginsenosidivorans TaxID=496057 RepID=A0A5B8VHU1_9BACT|nr:hypothetical protein [Arachidicoccus ginsenosidivorans]QEC70621.1 hypothetical protein FSB73_01825 [Arachidicoccus ginsenosidivorans]